MIVAVAVAVADYNDCRLNHHYNDCFCHHYNDCRCRCYVCSCRLSYICDYVFVAIALMFVIVILTSVRLEAAPECSSETRMTASTKPVVAILTTSLGAQSSRRHGGQATLAHHRTSQDAADNPARSRALDPSQTLL